MEIMEVLEVMLLAFAMVAVLAILIAVFISCVIWKRLFRDWKRRS